MEKLWMTILIKHFSNSKADILKFIRMAGYRDGEMVDLFDRTVGRAQRQTSSTRDSVKTTCANTSFIKKRKIFFKLFFFRKTRPDAWIRPCFLFQ